MRPPPDANTSWRALLRDAVVSRERLRAEGRHAPTCASLCADQSGQCRHFPHYCWCLDSGYGVLQERKEAARS